MYFAPLTPDRWPDLLTLFGRNSACNGCWCQAWRVPLDEFELGRAGKNRRALKEVVLRGPAPGVLGYHRGDVVGWCAIGPRADFQALGRSRVMRPVDGKAVWSLTCIFVARQWRGRGLMTPLVRAALVYARDSGVSLVEAYPMDTDERQQDAYVWTGVASTLRAIGFEEVARRAPRRPILRFDLSRLPPGDPNSSLETLASAATPPPSALLSPPGRSDS